MININQPSAEAAEMRDTLYPDDEPKSQPSTLQKDVGATSSEYESRQSYLRGPRLHLITAS